MDFRFTDAEDRFRQEVRDFIASASEGWTGFLAAESEEQWELSREFCKRLAERGWIGRHWPSEYGGEGVPYTDQLVLLEEMAYAMAPRGPIYHGWDRVAWTLLVHGTEAQRRLHLPRIRSAEVMWCQAFTEPNAGSDLASLETTATRDGDAYLITGEKIYNSMAWKADWALLPVRTDPAVSKHAGLSYFLLDLHLDGIDRRRLHDMLGQPHFGHLMLRDVRVPTDCLLGGVEGKGWAQMSTTLNAERAGVAVTRLGYCRRGFDEVCIAAQELTRNGAPLVEDPLVRAAVADLFVDLEALRLLAYRVGWAQHGGEAKPYQAAIAKMFGCELQRRIYDLGMRLLGPLGLVESWHGDNEGRALLTHEWLESFGQTIAGGTTEIQRNVIAQGLGLPRAS